MASIDRSLTPKMRWVFVCFIEAQLQHHKDDPSVLLQNIQVQKVSGKSSVTGAKVEKLVGDDDKKSLGLLTIPILLHALFLNGKRHLVQPLLAAGESLYSFNRVETLPEMIKKYSSRSAAWTFGPNGLQLAEFLISSGRFAEMRGKGPVIKSPKEFYQRIPEKRGSGAKTTGIIRRKVAGPPAEPIRKRSSFKMTELEKIIYAIKCERKRKENDKKNPSVAKTATIGHVITEEDVLGADEDELTAMIQSEEWDMPTLPKCMHRQLYEDLDAETIRGTGCGNTAMITYLDDSGPHDLVRIFCRQHTYLGDSYLDKMKKWCLPTEQESLVEPVRDIVALDKCIESMMTEIKTNVANRVKITDLWIRLICHIGQRIYITLKAANRPYGVPVEYWVILWIFKDKIANSWTPLMREVKLDVEIGKAIGEWPMNGKYSVDMLCQNVDETKIYVFVNKMKQDLMIKE